MRWLEAFEAAWRPISVRAIVQLYRSVAELMVTVLVRRGSLRCRTIVVDPNCDKTEPLSRYSAPPGNCCRLAVRVPPSATS